MNRPRWTIVAQRGNARAGLLDTPSGVVETPAFMPVGTYGGVKAIFPRDLAEMGFRLVLANTVHLFFRPGKEVIQKAGGIHRFLGWHGAILTDSGGFQVISMADLRHITEEGVVFRSPVDGTRALLSPEAVVAFQEAIGSDIMMPLDHPAPYPATEQETRDALERTTRWLERSLEARTRPELLIFGIIQGGYDLRLRADSARMCLAYDASLDGYAVGGLSFGEPKEMTLQMLSATLPHLPPEKPRYLMGMGTPEDIRIAVELGVDLFDCVLPTRLGRHGTAFTSSGKISLKNARYREDFAPLDPECSCYACTRFSRAYLRHLYMGGEILASMLLTLHNLHYYQQLVQAIRQEIVAHTSGDRNVRT
ncbi:MAG: tRNA guanosine(34) transglycosylase Tgt [bacterium JZ-2024 1]